MTDDAPTTEFDRLKKLVADRENVPQPYGKEVADFIAAHSGVHAADLAEMLAHALAEIYRLKDRGERVMTDVFISVTCVGPDAGRPLLEDCVFKVFSSLDLAKSAAQAETDKPMEWQDTDGGSFSDHGEGAERCIVRILPPASTDVGGDAHSC
jgi:hypothetical protein